MKRTYTRNFGQTSMTNYAPSYKRRPFKKVRADGTGLVPYGRSQLYTQARRPYQVGARGISKGVDTYYNKTDLFSAMATNDDVVPLNLIQAGTGSWNRVGRVLTMKSVRMRAEVHVRYPTTKTDTFSRQLRYIIVYDSQPNGTLPVKSDIIQWKNQSGTETGAWSAFLSYDNMQRFTILKDDTITFETPPRVFDNAGAPVGQVAVEKFIECYLPLNHITNYKAESTPSTISDISTGALYCVFLTDQITASASHSEPLLSVQNAYFRLRYVDKQ